MARAIHIEYMPPVKGSKRKTAANAIVEEVVVDPPVEKKKAKKPVKVVAIVTPQGIEGSFQPEPRRPLIVHLGIRTSDLAFNEAVQVETEPEPYDASISNMFAGGQEPISEKAPAEVPVEVKPLQEARPIPCSSSRMHRIQRRCPSVQRSPASGVRIPLGIGPVSFLRERLMASITSMATSVRQSAVWPIS